MPRHECLIHGDDLLDFVMVVGLVILLVPAAGRRLDTVFEVLAGPLARVVESGAGLGEQRAVRGVLDQPLDRLRTHEAYNVWVWPT